jgi:excisionase family DNA binding protein
MSQLSTGLGDIEKLRANDDRLAVKPVEAARLLSVCLATIYDLMRRGELPSFRTGRARRIPTPAIHNYINQRLAAAAGGWQQQPRRRRRSVG